MSIVSNTSPLIAFAKVDHLRLLFDLYERVFIPPAVHRELLAKAGPEAERLDQALADFIEVTERPTLTPETELATLVLDAGEREAVALSYQRSWLLIIDDRLGRQAARRLNLTVTGTAGVLLTAKAKGYVAAVRPLLESMRQRGYWLSDELIAAATELAGEA